MSRASISKFISTQGIVHYQLGRAFMHGFAHAVPEEFFLCSQFLENTSLSPVDFATLDALEVLAAKVLAVPCESSLDGDDDDGHWWLAKWWERSSWPTPSVSTWICFIVLDNLKDFSWQNTTRNGVPSQRMSETQYCPFAKL